MRLDALHWPQTERFLLKIHGGAQWPVLVLCALSLPLPGPGSHDRKLLNLFIHTCLILILHIDSACGVKKMDERSQGQEGVRVMMSLDLINYITQDTSHSKGHSNWGLWDRKGRQVGETNQFFLEITTLQNKAVQNLLFSLKMCGY